MNNKYLKSLKKFGVFLGNAINRSQIHYKIKILNSEKFKINSYSFLYINEINNVGIYFC